MDLFAKTMLAEVTAFMKRACACERSAISALSPQTREAFDEAWEKTRQTTV